MNDKELLALCADAFDATLVAARARKILNSGRIPKIAGSDIPYAGNRSHVLAKVMRERVREHLEINKIAPVTKLDFTQISESKLDPAYAGASGSLTANVMQPSHVEDLERKIALVMAHDSNLIDGLERLAAQK